MNKKRSSSFRFIAAASATTLLFLTPALRAQQRQTLGTAVAAPARAQLVGRLPGAQQLHLALTLALHNEAQLNTLLNQLYDPSSPNYHQFLTVEQFTSQFGPTSDDYAKVVGFAQAHGLTIANTAANRLVLDVGGAASDVEQAFQVKMQVYRHPTENRTYFAPDVEPSVEPGIPVQGINGLNSFSPPRPLLQFAPAGSVHPNQTGSGPGGQFLGSDMRAAYYGGTALTGAGQAIGLFEFAPYNLSDVQAYFSTISQPLNVPIVNVVLDGISPICGTCDDGEQVIDIQQAISMAPGAAAVIVYEGSNDTDMFNQMAIDNIAKQLSCSWGWLPADPKSDEPIFLEFAAQGQNLFVASGDSGAYTPPGCSGNDCNPAFYPEDDPLITAAGGTHITTNGPGGPWESEIAWGGNPALACGYPTGGSSGGYSTNGLPIPGYQQLKGVINSSNDGSTTLRNVPDVAAEADCDNYYCADSSCQGGVGGTSLAAPRWAGFMALANEQANGTPIGFLNPAFYAIGTAASYGRHFHDIASGSNNNGLGETYNAVAGYDLVTGWGSPNGQGLIDVLGPVPTGPNFALTATPSTLNVTQGSTATSSITLTALRGFEGAANLTVTALGQPAGVTASLNPATVTGSSGSTLSVATTGATPGGNFPIVVTGTASGLTQTAYVTLALPGFSLAAPANIFLNQNGRAAATITVNAVNGFNGSVTFSLSGLPSGVKASIDPGSATGSTQLFLSATSQAATGYANVTVVGTSGNLTQSANINLAVSGATGTGGSGTQADLSAAYNVFGIYNNGVTYTNGGMDGDGYSYSAKLLTPSRILYGMQFNFGPANHADAVSGTGQAIALPAGQFSRLSLLATGVNGSQTAQTIIVTYTDGSTAEVTRSFSDWFVPSNFPGEIEAVAMQYRNANNGTEDDRTFNLYAYPLALDNTKTVRSFTLPSNPNLVVLAATLIQ